MHEAKPKEVMVEKRSAPGTTVKHRKECSFVKNGS